MADGRSGGRLVQAVKPLYAQDRQTVLPCAHVSPSHRSGLLRRLGNPELDQCRPRANQESQRPSLVSDFSVPGPDRHVPHRSPRPRAVRQVALPPFERSTRVDGQPILSAPLRASALGVYPDPVGASPRYLFSAFFNVALVFQASLLHSSLRTLCALSVSALSSLFLGLKLSAVGCRLSAKHPLLVTLSPQNRPGTKKYYCSIVNGLR
jgi:hypothetical protein